MKQVILVASLVAVGCSGTYNTREEEMRMRGLTPADLEAGPDETDIRTRIVGDVREWWLPETRLHEGTATCAGIRWEGANPFCAVCRERPPMKRWGMRRCGGGWITLWGDEMGCRTMMHNTDPMVDRRFHRVLERLEPLGLDGALHAEAAHADAARRAAILEAAVSFDRGADDAAAARWCVRALRFAAAPAGGRGRFVEFEP